MASSDSMYHQEVGYVGNYSVYALIIESGKFPMSFPFKNTKTFWYVNDELRCKNSKLFEIS